MEHESEKNQDEQNWSRRVQPEGKIEAVAESGSMDIDALEPKTNSKQGFSRRTHSV